MRFVQFLAHGKVRLGALITVTAKNVPSVQVVDIGLANENLPHDMLSILQSPDPTTMNDVRRAVDSEECRRPVNSVRLISPISNPGKIMCIGLNYRDHCEELGLPVPKVPVIFNKLPSSIVGPNCNIIHPSETQALDWEVELAVVIGKRANHVEESKAMDHVFGYTVANDVSARDWFSADINAGQWIIGKSMDTFCPLGPAIVTKDEIEDPHNLQISCRVNGDIKQNGNTKHMAHRIETLVSLVSRYCTLHPGDLLLTGTPPGVGSCMKPPQFLKKGDVVECEIENVGTISNQVQ